eukprot:1854534-Amphidinium_carterae.1
MKCEVDACFWRAVWQDVPHTRSRIRLPQSHALNWISSADDPNVPRHGKCKTNQPGGDEGHDSPATACQGLLGPLPMIQETPFPSQNLNSKLG